MDYGIRILKEVLDRVTAMTVEEYNALYASVEGVNDIKLAAIEFTSTVEYLAPHDKDAASLTSMYTESHKKASYTFPQISEHYGFDTAYSVA